MDIITLTPADSLWSSAVDFSQNCHWIIREMAARNHTWQTLTVAVQDHQVLGFSGFTQPTTGGIQRPLSTLFIDEQARGRGVAGKIMSEVRNLAQSRAIQEVAIPGVVQDIFEKYGFTVVS